MLKSLKNRNQQGFTIIEVLIVLAIAGLIMVVVFLAVPALQRNSRNNSRTTDINNLSSAVAEYSANNEGKLPAASVANTANSDAEQVFKSTKTGFYVDASKVSVVAQSTVASTTVTNADAEVKIVTSAKCDTNGKVVAGNARQFAIQFAVEGGSGNVSRCQNG